MVSHTQFILGLIESGRIKSTLKQPEKVVFHDPCYMARYNNSVGTPRKILDAIDGLTRVENLQRGKTAMCCGAGGGQMWMESSTKKINFIRLTDLRKSASTVAVGCPHCLTMFESAMSDDKVLSGMDIIELSELVAAGLEEKVQNG